MLFVENHNIFIEINMDSAKVFYNDSCQNGTSNWYAILVYRTENCFVKGSNPFVLMSLRFCIKATPVFSFHISYRISMADENIIKSVKTMSMKSEYKGSYMIYVLFILFTNVTSLLLHNTNFNLLLDKTNRWLTKLFQSNILPKSIDMPQYTICNSFTNLQTGRVYCNPRFKKSMESMKLNVWNLPWIKYE